MFVCHIDKILMAFGQRRQIGCGEKAAAGGGQAAILACTLYTVH